MYYQNHLFSIDIFYFAILVKLKIILSDGLLTSGRVVLGVFRRLSPDKVGLLPFLFPRVVESMKGLSRRGFNISGAGARGICRRTIQC